MEYRGTGRKATVTMLGVHFGSTRMRDYKSVPTANWRFYYLDESYQKSFGGGGVSPSTPHRSPICVYSDVGQSTVTGNQVTDLLREIPHDPTKMSYEPRHILYLPVRVEVMDIIETQLAENDGTLVDFALGVTTLTLHFKYE